MVAFSSTPRQSLAGDAIFYVDESGNDANDGFSLATAKRQPQAMISWMFNNLDCRGLKACIQLGDSTTPYNAFRLFPVMGSDGGNWPDKSLMLRGNTTDLSAVNINGPGYTAVTAVNCSDGWTLEGLWLTASGGGCHIVSDFGSAIYVGKNRFGACDNWQMSVYNNSRIEPIDDYEIAALTSGATLGQGHFYGTKQSTAIWQPKTVTLTNTPKFLNSFLFSGQGSNVSPIGVTWSGFATADTRRFITQTCGGIDTGGNLSGLPGGVAGTNGGWAQ